MYNTVLVTRGDTTSIYVNIRKETALDAVTEEDTIYFGLLDFKQPFENALLKKRFTYKDLSDDGELIITITPRDTLDLLPGTYFGTVKLHRVRKAEGIDEVITVIDRAKIIINA